MPGAGGVSPTAPDDRIEWIDAVRGMVLFGVLIVNLVTEFRVSIFQQFLGTPDTPLERAISLLFAEKAFSLFSLLFGIGLAMQFDRLSATGWPLYWLARRLGVLLAFGLAHLLLIWNGDILTEYALAGLVALLLLRLRPAGLLLVATGFLVVYAVGPGLYTVPWPGPEALRLHVASANQVYATGGIAEILRFSWSELSLVLSLHALVFPRTLALFVFGMFLWRAGIVQRARDLADEMIAVAVVGIAGGIALAYGALRSAGIVLWALGYGAALVAFAQISIAQRVVAVFAPIGRMAFTNYLMQSIIFGFIFFGYGLGQFGRMGAPLAVAIGIAVYVAQMLFSRWWLRRYRFGPIEWLWRTLMYGTVQPMRKT